jgi:hypothetical protein
MTDLSRSLLAAARDGLTPDAEVAARVRARVASAVAPAAATSSTAAAGSSGALLKLAALAFVAGVITTGFVIDRGPRANAPSLSLLTRDTDEPAAAIAPTASRESATPRAGHRITTATTYAIGTSSATALNDEREPASLGREVELIDNAMGALRNHDPASALQTLTTFEHETLGHAQLAEDAAAIELEARCALREDVTARLAAFDTKWPSSAQRARISAACR